MEKTVEICGKKVTFKKTGGTMLRYKAQTGREFYADLNAFLKCAKLDKSGKVQHDSDGKPLINMSEFRIDFMFDILHIMARSADFSVPADVLDWAESFEDFNVVKIFCEVLPMLSDEMKIDEKNALTASARNRRKKKQNRTR